jgi:hypothetical protein
MVASGNPRKPKAQRKKIVIKSIPGRSFFLAFKDNHRDLVDVETNTLPDELNELIGYLVFRNEANGQKTGYLYTSKDNVNDTKVLRVFSKYLSHLKVQKVTLIDAVKKEFLDNNDGNFMLRLGIAPRSRSQAGREGYQASKNKGAIDMFNDGENQEMVVDTISEKKVEDVDHEMVVNTFEKEDDTSTTALTM